MHIAYARGDLPIAYVCSPDVADVATLSVKLERGPRASRLSTPFLPVAGLACVRFFLASVFLLRLLSRRSGNNSHIVTLALCSFLAVRLRLEGQIRGGHHIGSHGGGALLHRCDAVLLGWRRARVCHDFSVFWFVSILGVWIFRFRWEWDGEVWAFVSVTDDDEHGWFLVRVCFVFLLCWSHCCCFRFRQVVDQYWLGLATAREWRGVIPTYGFAFLFRLAPI